MRDIGVLGAVEVVQVVAEDAVLGVMLVKEDIDSLGD